MHPHINSTEFGYITINNTTYPYDVYILADGAVEKRQKKLSKQIYGTSHTISRDEIKYIYREGVHELIIGSGQYGAAQLAGDAAAFLHQHKCTVRLMPTPEAITVWNQTEGKVIALFHVTC
ncbi:MAG TPA: MTH938/NDUFAF3 family protein [bacterium]|nr:MTH938/NDUFAF3 family protein [bacterium]HPN45669.1 MTH938/NDUFAF3 family protein [bacterium]